MFINISPRRHQPAAIDHLCVLAFATTAFTAGFYVMKYTTLLRKNETKAFMKLTLSKINPNINFIQIYGMISAFTRIHPKIFLFTKIIFASNITATTFKLLQFFFEFEKCQIPYLPTLKLKQSHNFLEQQRCYDDFRTYSATFIICTQS